jgi:hypothetical protein
MLSRILIVLSCNLAYWQYSDGTQSVIAGWDYCQMEREYVLEERARERARQRKLQHAVRMARLKAAIRLDRRRVRRCLPGFRDAAARTAGKCR